MKRLLPSAALAAALAAAATPSLAADVGVSINVGQPGFYGQIDIGNYPRPQVLYAEPVIIHRAPVGVVHRPMYLHVPPGHARDWGKHCGKYNACAQPVYFVREQWYNDVYAPRYRAGPAAYRDDRRDDWGDDRGRRGDDRGRGKGKDKDRGNGRGHGRD